LRKSSALPELKTNLSFGVLLGCDVINNLTIKVNIFHQLQTSISLVIRVMEWYFLCACIIVGVLSVLPHLLAICSS
jgi:hypothetical protein